MAARPPFSIRSAPTTWQATFGDPAYGGNRDFIGWDLIGYPGPRRAVSAEEQAALEAGTLEPLRRSAYE